MAHSTVSNVRLVGIASAVPEPIITLADEAKVFGPTEIERISQTVGVQQRHVATDLICTSDLCHAAGEKLLTELDWSRDSVDALVFVSQTGDYILPSTSCSLQDRLGLSKGCAALDINHGCTGYVYGMWVASQLLSANGIKRVLLLVGDTTSRLVSPQDRSLATLFGDAGTATALQWDSEAGDTHFELGSDGSGKEHLMVKAGGFRQPRTSQTGVRTERENNNIRSDEDLFMDGAEVFTFAIREVPPLIKRIHEASGWTTESVDAYVFHQANKFMLDYLSKRTRLPKEKVPLAMDHFGNTSCASIPLTLTTELASRLSVEPMNLIMTGFGVGLSWGAVAMNCGPLVLPALQVVPEPTCTSRASVKNVG